MPEYASTSQGFATHDPSRAHDGDKEMDMLADRIAEKVLRGGMGERHTGPTLFDTLHGQRAGEDYANEPAMQHSGPLAQIAKMIEGHADQMQEVAHKLNAHADRIYGAAPAEALGKDGAATRPSGLPALDRIFVALSRLEHVNSEVATAAGRNTTLA